MSWFQQDKLIINCIMKDFIILKIRNTIKMYLITIEKVTIKKLNNTLLTH